MVAMDRRLSSRGNAEYSKVDECEALERDVIWSEKVRCLLKMKPRFRAVWEVASKELCIFAKLFFYSDEQEFSLRGVTSK